jgi:aldose 1-epimerase
VKLTQGEMIKEYWGCVDGKEVFLFHLLNKHGMRLTVCNYGAIVQKLMAADSRGNVQDVVLGYDTLEEYINDPFYVGAVVGRFANRIEEGRINIHGTDYVLTKTSGGYHQHGGTKGFNKKVWDPQILQDHESVGIKLEYISADNEEGFPGNLKVTVIYTLHDSNEWTTQFFAEADKPTVLNLTQHSYFNLTGILNSSIAQHALQLHTTYYLPVTANVIPTGEYASVENTPFDFSSLHPIGENIEHEHQQMQYTSGYDHTWVLKKANSNDLVLAATLYEPESKRVLKVFTTEPGIHIYTGNFLSSSITGKNKTPFQPRCGICLETQHFGNSPNQPQFPSTLLEPGDIFESKTLFRFACE